MSIKLPYFKFFSGEWLNGDITLEDYELQGLFISVCAYYWHRDCEVTYEQLAKKFRTNQLADLVPEFIQVDDNEEFVSIEFLDEQFSEFSTRKKKLSEAGRKGAKRKAEKKNEAMNKPPLSHPLATREDKDKDKDKEEKKKLSIEDRKKSFSEKVFEIGSQHDKKMLEDFISYWSEHGEEDRKMRFEKMTSFSISRRLGTWKRNEQKFKANGSQNNTNGNRARTTTSERQSFE